MEPSLGEASQFQHPAAQSSLSIKRKLRSGVELFDIPEKFEIFDDGQSAVIPPLPIINAQGRHPGCCRPLYDRDDLIVDEQLTAIEASKKDYRWNGISRFF